MNKNTYEMRFNNSNNVIVIEKDKLKHGGPLSIYEFMIKDFKVKDNILNVKLYCCYNKKTYDVSIKVKNEEVSKLKTEKNVFEFLKNNSLVTLLK